MKRNRKRGGGDLSKTKPENSIFHKVEMNGLIKT
jgi:hypothetical protein